MLWWRAHAQNLGDQPPPAATLWNLRLLGLAYQPVSICIAHRLNVWRRIKALALTEPPLMAQRTEKLRIDRTLPRSIRQLERLGKTVRGLLKQIKSIRQLSLAQHASGEEYKVCLLKCYLSSETLMPMSLRSSLLASLILCRRLRFCK